MKIFKDFWLNTINKRSDNCRVKWVALFIYYIRGAFFTPLELLASTKRRIPVGWWHRPQRKTQHRNEERAKQQPFDRDNTHSLILTYH